MKRDLGTETFIFVAAIITIIFVGSAGMMTLIGQGGGSGQQTYALGVAPNETTIVNLGVITNTLTVSFNATTPIYVQVLATDCGPPSGCLYQIASDYGTSGWFTVQIQQNNEAGINVDLSGTAPSVVSLEVLW